MRNNHPKDRASTRIPRTLCSLALMLSIPCTVCFAAQSIEPQLIQKIEAGKYAKKGAKTCLKCHKRNKTVMAIFDGVHGNTEHSDSPMAGKQCETCHGPQGKHKGKNEPMISFGESSNLSTEFKNSICLSCHNDDGRTEHADGEACDSCHQVHLASDG